ncbi:MAG TPA: 5-(carboxyamino)imidazole ribonucleotide synthase [Dehalococcoidia bacterium]|nr:5-(carboxyamino)imidazole ribonucleotide synthase [Dehalococcoidia bacterium]
MNKDIITPPSSTLGMLGGGQLGGFFAEAALRMGYKVAVWDPSESAPAKRFATHKFNAPFNDKNTLNEFVSTVDAVSLEWENIPVELVEAIQSKKPTRPSSRSLGLAQDRTKEKRFLRDNGFPLSEYQVIKCASELVEVDQELPWIVKTATMGYDGHGQWRINSDHEKDQMSSQIKGEGPWVAEKVVPFDMELSVVVIQGTDGTCVTYPATENIHENGILRMSICPARIDPSTELSACNLATEVIKAIGDPGVFCVELFLVHPNQILVNEIAPRPHNSGHHTIDSFSISQYEYQVRALCGLSITQPFHIGNTVLLNVLGEEATELSQVGITNLILKTGRARIYMYGKESVRPGRKMGHIIFSGGNIDVLEKEASEALAIISDQ